MPSGTSRYSVLGVLRPTEIRAWMTTRRETVVDMDDTSLDYFASMYAHDPDPWGFDRRWYERRKYALTMAALPHERFRRALEPGCANGALTELLAERCEHVIAYDFETSAVTRARERVGRHEHVDVVAARFPDWRPHGRGDLVVLSEVAYYLGPTSADQAIELLDGWLDTDGILVAVHFTGTTDYPRRGADIGPWLDATGFLSRLTTIVDESFEVGVWRRGRPDPRASTTDQSGSLSWRSASAAT